MVVPVAAAQQVTRGFRSTMAVAMLIGLASAGLGVLDSAEADTAPGATTVLMALVAFLGATIGGLVRRNLRHRTSRPPVAAEPPDVVLRD
jgi:zinc transport system permease protein